MSVSTTEERKCCNQKPIDVSKFLSVMVANIIFDVSCVMALFLVKEVFFYVLTAFSSYVRPFGLILRTNILKA